MAMFTEYLYEEGIDGIENVKKLLDEAEKKMVNKTSRDYIQFVSNFIKTNKLRPDLVEEVINCLDTWIYFESDKDNNNYTIDDMAAESGNIPLEILTGLNYRSSRMHINYYM